MNTPYWFSNFTYWSAQVALLVLAAGFLPHLFQIRQPRVLLIYWRALIVISLLLPFVQPYRPQYLASVRIVAIQPQDLARELASTPIFRTSGATVSYWQTHSVEIIAQIIGLIILAGIAARFTILALGLLKLRQFRQSSSPISNHAESSAVLDAMRVRVNTGGEFRLSSDVDSPVTFGLAVPVILLPERFPTLDAQYQSAIACHELFHVRRRDWAHHLSEEILRAVLWFHPAIAWLIARIRLSREQVVDLEVIKLTDALKPYLEALLEFTNSRALATAIPAPPFLVERQLAERVALMLKEVRMSRTRLIASLTAIAAYLAVVATLAVWTFPLKAAPRSPQNPPQVGIVQGVSGGVIGGVTGGVIIGVPGGITGGAPIQGVKGGVSDGVKSSRYVSVKDPLTGRVIGEITVVDGPGPFGSRFVRNSQLAPTAAPPPQQDDKSARDAALNVINPVPPVYPPEAVENHLEGRVNLTLTVNAEGKVSNVEFINGSPEFVQAATDAAFQWEFKPPTKAPAIMTASFDFTLSPGRTHAPFVEPPKDPRAVSSLKMSITKQDPSPLSAPPPANPKDSHIVGKFQFIPASASSSQSNNGAVYRAGENGVTTPKCVYCPKPEYSAEARTAKLMGTVTLQVTVLANGHPGEITLLKGIGSGLDDKAIDTVRNKWTFTPANGPDGKPVDSTVPVEILFQLDPNANGVSMPVCEYCPKPEYSAEAKKARLMGTVYLQVVVLANGRAGEIKLTQGLGMGLDEQAIDTVRKKWKFKPAIGPKSKPVMTMVPVEIKFELY